MGAEPSREVLGEVVGRVLEEAAFVFTEAVDEAPPFEGPVIEARLRYGDEGEGEIRLAAEPRFAATLAANLLGSEPDDPEAAERAMDAVGELLNMVSGVLVAELHGPEAPTALGVPSVTRVSAEEHERDLREAACRVTFVEEAGHRIDAAALRRVGGGT